MAKEKLPRFNTPKGTLKFPWLHEPSTKFNPDGTYQTGLLLSEKEAAPLIETINKLVDEHYNAVYNEAKKKDKDKLQKQYPYAPEAYEDEEENEVETGMIEFRFKQNAKVTSQKTGKTYEFKVGLFDIYGKPIPPEQRIFGGSVAIVNFSPRTFYVPPTTMNNNTPSCGVTLQLNAVQVHEFGSGGDSAASYGFTAEEEPVGMPTTEGVADDF